MRSGQEIQAALRAFVKEWESYSGGERSEAQTFLNQLFSCYGTDRKAVGARFEDFKSSAGFMDLHWPGQCIIEMKAPSHADVIHDAREQVMRYWRESSVPEKDQPAARWVVICAFHRFEVWEPGRFPSQPRASFDLAELPDRYESLRFLAGPSDEPVFLHHHKKLTEDAASTMALLYQSLKDRSAAPLDEVQRFTLQCVWSLFAEDLGMLEEYPLQNIVAALMKDSSRSSAAEIGHLFRVLNQKGNHNRKGLLAGTRYVNGDLFSQPSGIDLEKSELELLARAAEYDWRYVNPTIFGSLLEGVLGRTRRWELGAHYTHEADILRIVLPTVVAPWEERIDKTKSPVEALHLLDELCAFRVLDPACGCGNFLYIAYRELRRLEHLLKARIYELAAEQGLPKPQGPFPYYPLSNLHGMDIEQVSVLIARVTLWMGHRQMIELYGEAEAPLPLVDLSSLRVGDALRINWPATDSIIGNPPFLGASHVRGAKGTHYAEWLKRTYGIGIKDYCVYWFRRAHDHLKDDQRAGLVGTNSITQNLGRSASLDYIAQNGGIFTSAVSSQRWPGEAKVHVSLVNWVKSPSVAPATFLLDGHPVAGINSELRPTRENSWTPAPLAVNKNRCFEGPSPKAKGLVLDEAEAQSLLARKDANYPDVVRPYLTADDITDDPNQNPSRWAIDFGLRTLEEARRYRAAFEIVKERVQPERSTNNRKSYREKYWIFAEPRRTMRQHLTGLSRYIATARHAKRFVLCWCDPWTLASDATNVFAYEDDYSMGILQSSAHAAWAWERSSTLKADLRYTPTSTFMTFVWPIEPSEVDVAKVSEASRELLARRREICSTEGIGLTQLYNLIDEGAYTDLKGLHLRLDRAVASCYGWSSSVAQNDEKLVSYLYDLNEQAFRQSKD